MDRHHPHLPSLFSFTLIFLVAGCGGGSGSSDEPGPSDETNTNDSGVTEVNDFNGDIKGWLFVSDWGVYYDLSNGLMTKLTSGSNVSISPSVDGTEYVETIKEYYLKKDPSCHGFSAGIERINIRDIHTNLINDWFEVFEEVWGAAKLSPDGESIAVDWADNEGCPSGEIDSLLTVFTRSGEVISQSDEEVGDFAWLPDNRLVYANNGAIYVGRTKYQVDGEMVNSLEGVTGWPGRINVSPDGSKIVFEMITGRSGIFETVFHREATAWMMNIDGSDLHMLATSNKYDDPDTDIDDPRINNPVWSIDGKKVLLTEGYIDGAAVVPVLDMFSEYVDHYISVPVDATGLCYAISSQERGVGLPPDGSLMATIVTKMQGGEHVPLIADYDSTLMLVPAAVTPPENPGSLPGASDIVNRGIGGKVYFVDDAHGNTVVYALDLTTGYTSEIVNISNDEHDMFDIAFSMTSDAQYFAYYDYEYLDEKYIRVINASGEEVNAYSMYTNSYDMSPRRIHFSPVDSNLLLFEYVDRNDDDKHYVTVLDRASDTFLKRFTDRQYINPVWLPSGDLVMWDYSGVAYQVSVTQRSIGEPVKLFDTFGGIYHNISSDGSKARI
jgi:Tol biopolymer transport system component